jgi:hypothetical protein
MGGGDALRQKLPLHKRSFRQSASANTFLAILRGAVRHCHRACVAHARAEPRIRQRLRLFGFGSQSRLFPSALTRATKDRSRSQEIVGRRARSSNLVVGSDTTRDPLSQKPCFRIAGRRSPLRKVTGFQSKCFDSNFRKRSVRLDSFIRRHYGRNDCRGLGRISFGYEKDGANRWTAT